MMDFDLLPKLPLAFSQATLFGALVIAVFETMCSTPSIGRAYAVGPFRGIPTHASVRSRTNGDA